MSGKGPKKESKKDTTSMPRRLEKEMSKAEKTWDGRKFGPTRKKGKSKKDVKKQKRDEKKHRKAQNFELQRERRKFLQQGKDVSDLSLETIRDREAAKAEAIKSAERERQQKRREEKSKAKEAAAAKAAAAAAAARKQNPTSIGSNFMEVLKENRLAVDSKGRFAPTQDELEEKRLLKKLGMKKGKMPGSLKKDGLDVLLKGGEESEGEEEYGLPAPGEGGSDSEDIVPFGEPSDSESDAWDGDVAGMGEIEDEENGDLSLGDELGDEDGEEMLGSDVDLDLGEGSDEDESSGAKVGEKRQRSDEDSENDENEEEEEDNEVENATAAKRQRTETEPASGKYVPPQLRGANASTAKAEEKASTAAKVAAYVPPHLRATSGGPKSEEYMRLQKRVRGLLNRLSATNVEPVLAEFSDLYSSGHKRADLNEILTENLLNSVCDPVQLLSHFVLSFAALIAALHTHVGSEVGAYFLEKLCRRFDTHRQQGDSKQASNALVLLCHLYNFEVVHCTLIYDVIRLLLDSFSELDIELLLKLLKTCGFELRSDDPASLKDIVLLVQTKATELKARLDKEKKAAKPLAAAASKAAEGDEESAELGLRVSFMLDTIYELKNNKKKKENEEGERTKAALKALQKKAGITSSSPLRISWKDLMNSEKKGRWWLIGAAWSAEGAEEDENNTSAESRAALRAVDERLLQMAVAQRMNTDIRKAIFCIVMGSEDCLDAYEKLVRLNLKNKQDREIVRVILHCCGQERTFNPFYGLLAKQLCHHDRNHKHSFQVAFADLLSQIDEAPLRRVANLARLLSFLVGHSAIPLLALKCIEFTRLQKNMLLFVRLFMMNMLLDFDDDVINSALKSLLASHSDDAELVKEGLALVLHHFAHRDFRSTFLHEILPSRVPDPSQLAAKEAAIIAKAVAARGMLQGPAGLDSDEENSDGEDDEDDMYAGDFEI